MIKVQDVWLRKSSASVAKPDKPTRVSGGIINLLLEPRRQYPVKGVTTMDGEQFTVVAASDSPDGYTGVLVRSDGSLHNRVVFGVSGASVFGRSGHGDTLGNVVYTMTISDPSVRLRREIEQTVIAAKGFESFELLYTGTSPAGLTLTYREFSPEGLARVAFFQNLVYDVGAKVIQFRKFRILVQAARRPLPTPAKGDTSQPVMGCLAGMGSSCSPPRRHIESSTATHTALTLNGLTPLDRPEYRGSL